MIMTVLMKLFGGVNFFKETKVRKNEKHFFKFHGVRSNYNFNVFDSTHHSDHEHLAPIRSQIKPK